ncbi:serine hydrolase domain-containing protein [Tunicatimonas pelagia]|uniref:serine hydrolase domain-containing protein n=1 Tax=Tunicatimonas pelagia TaxID=931531 RepID=UPI002665E6B7|nr:serine hydrolase domain-containing protein [Tunicatimonas pelagia]WKN44811.1 serine hydrolase [Tunicatimonas pelagia]
MQRILRKCAPPRLSFLPRIHSFISIGVFTLLYLGVPFSIAESGQAALGNSYKDYVHSVELLMNKHSALADFAPIDQAMDKFIQRQGIVGASLGIVKDGKLIYAKGFGFTGQETEEAVQPHHLFRIGSVSKLITAVAIMKLREDGRLQMDEPVFGENGVLNTDIYRGIKDKKHYKITVEHLLNHTGGWSKRSFGDPLFIPLRIADAMEIEGTPDLDTIIKFILSKNLPYRPGTRYDYSNFGYCLLGRVIEARSGKSYEDFVKTEILAPLGITNMHLAKNRAEDRFENEVSYYDLSSNNMRPDMYGSGELVSNAYSFNIEALGAAGGWVATSADLMKFLVAVDGFKNSPDILSNESLLSMIETKWGRPYGWRSAKVGGTWWRTGTLAGTSALIKRHQDGTSWVILANTSNHRSRYFTGRISYIMQQELSQLDEWPEHDLFSVSYYQ